MVDRGDVTLPLATELAEFKSLAMPGECRDGAVKLLLAVLDAFCALAARVADA